MKRFLFLMVLFCMGIMSGFAQGNEFTYTDDNGVIWGGYISFDYNYEDGTQTLQDVSINSTSNNNEAEVVIPGEIYYDGKKYTVTSLGNVFSRNKIVEKVTIPKTVTSLHSTFSECSALSEIVNTSQLKSVYYAFNKCSSIKSIDLSSCEIVGSNSFGGCTQLESVVLKSCKEIESAAFYDYFSESCCRKLKSVGDISHCESIGEDAFNGCSSLTSVDLSSCKTIGKESFYGCSVLKSVGSTKLLTNIPESAFCGCSNLQNIDLSNCTSIGSSAFYNCGIEKIDLSAIKTIGESAFSNCSGLTEVTGLKLIKSLPDGAFEECHKLSSIDLSKIESLGLGCMSGTAVVSVNLSNLKKWGVRVFKDCKKLTSVTFPESIESIPTMTFWNCEKLCTIDLSHCSLIGSGAFYKCTSLTDVNLLNVKQIEYMTYTENYHSYEGGSFMYCNNLTSVTLDSCQNLGNKAFYDCTQLNDVFTYTILPVKINQNTFCTYETATLHVPVQSYDNYYWDTEWSQFHAFEDFNEPYKYFYLNKEYILASRIDGCPNIDIRDNGGLIVKGDAIQNAGDIHVSGSGTIIANGNVDASKFHIDIDVTSNYWYFLSFPFDVKLSDIAAPGQFVFRKYDGATRASQGAGGWKDLDASDKWLHRGTGYIFQSAESGKLTLPVVKEKFGKLEAEDVQETLGTFASSNEQNASWNFVGNPHTSYFDMDDLGYNAPITYWNGMSYEAVRPGDDNYVFKPFQAFFVQKPQNVNEMEFGAEFRLTQTGSQKRSSDNKAKRLAKGIDINRQMVNLTLSDGTHTDKTRVVFNEDKTQRYELDCDAAKFESSTSVPQLYTLEANNVKYAINERPLGSVSLGFEVQKAGDYTISAIRMDSPMLLKDNLTDATVDLSTSDYHFTSEAGTFNGRFTLMPNKSTTGIAEFAKNTGVSIIPTEGGINFSGVEGKHVSIYSLNGIEIGSTQSSGTINLGQGIYVVKMDNTSTKVMVK